MGEQLDLIRVSRTEMGAYLCIAQNGVPSPVSKRIMVHVHCKFARYFTLNLLSIHHFSPAVHPSLHARQNLVSTIAGSSATLECKVEASPRSVNYWVKLGAKNREMPVNPGGRFRTEDINENGYTQKMVLQIDEVRSKDFGTYQCVSRNSLGDVRTKVQLQGININQTYKYNNKNLKIIKYIKATFIHILRL